MERAKLQVLSSIAVADVGDYGRFQAKTFSGATVVGDSWSKADSVDWWARQVCSSISRKARQGFCGEASFQPQTHEAGSEKVHCACRLCWMTTWNLGSPKPRPSQRHTSRLERQIPRPEQREGCTSTTPLCGVKKAHNPTTPQS
jgi:hypothetical protein